MEYLLITILLFLAAAVYIKIAEKYNIIDNPSKRSSHTIPTIRGGGIIFVLAFLIFQIKDQLSLPFVTTGVLLIAVVSFIDDIKTLKPKTRFITQLMAVLAMLLELSIHQQSWIGFVILFFLGVWFLNLYNFMDGINGITGFYSAAILIVLLMLNQQGNVIPEEFLGYLLISIGIFGYYNFRKKARFFAGDIGSVSIALILCYLILLFAIKLESIMILLLVLVYFGDASITLVNRITSRDKLTEPHRKHMYQKLVDKTKLTHLQVSGIYALLQLLVGLIIVQTYDLLIIEQIKLFVIISAVYIIVYLFLLRYFKAKTV